MIGTDVLLLRVISAMGAPDAAMLSLQLQELGATLMGLGRQLLASAGLDGWGLALVALACLLSTLLVKQLQAWAIPSVTVHEEEGVCGRGAWVESAQEEGAAHAYMHAHAPVLTPSPPPSPPSTAESKDRIVAARHDPKKRVDKDVVPCYDPGSMQLLGHVPAMSTAQVGARTPADHATGQCVAPHCTPRACMRGYFSTRPHALCTHTRRSRASWRVRGRRSWWVGGWCGMVLGRGRWEQAHALHWSPLCSAVCKPTIKESWVDRVHQRATA